MKSRNLFLKQRSPLHGRWWIVVLLLAGLYLFTRSPEHPQEEFPWQPPIEPQGVTQQQPASPSAQPSTDAANAKARDEQPAVNPVQQVPPTATAQAAEASAAEPQNQIDERSRVQQAIERWSRAWSARDVNAYLAAYARTFVPAGGQGRSAWEQTRRQRILSKSAITHEVRSLQITLDGNKATARFEQTYTADHFRSVGPKTLQLELSGDQWLIVSESAS